MCVYLQNFLLPPPLENNRNKEHTANYRFYRLVRCHSLCPPNKPFDHFCVRNVFFSVAKFVIVSPMRLVLIDFCSIHANWHAQNIFIVFYLNLNVWGECWESAHGTGDRVFLAYDICGDVESGLIPLFWCWTMNYFCIFKLLRIPKSHIYAMHVTASNHIPIRPNVHLTFNHLK